MARRFTSILITAAITLAAVGCGGDEELSDPRKTVISLFGAMARNDQAQLTYLLDIPELMNSLNEDYALQTDQPRMLFSPEDVLYDLTGDGRTKEAWFSLQRIIGKTEITGEETATVTVTFVDKEASRGYMSRFGLHLVGDHWKIYSFRTVR